jgi:hypothetical protein
LKPGRVEWRSICRKSVWYVSRGGKEKWFCGLYVKTVDLRRRVWYVNKGEGRSAMSSRSDCG